MIERIKKELGKSSFGMSHKNFAILCGVMAQMMIINGSVIILERPITGILGILYAFFILLPICYYNMREHEAGLK